MAGFSSPSDWQDRPNPFSGLTPKQQDSEGSMYPGAFKPSDPVATGEKDTAARIKEAAQEEQAAPAEKQKRQQQYEGSGLQAAVQQVSQKLGTFQYQLQGYINQYLKGTPTAVGISSRVDPATGNTITETDLDKLLDPTVKQKDAERQRILGTMTGYGAAKEGVAGLEATPFTELLGKQAGGWGLDPAATARMLQISATLDSLEASGKGDTRDAQMLQQQLQEQDEFGFVSSLRDARKRYNQVMGLGSDTETWGEDTSKQLTARELATMKLDAIRDEVQKAKVSASGVFSGEFGSSLRRQFDTQSAAANASKKASDAINLKLKNAWGSYLEGAEGTLNETRNQISSALSAAAPQIAAAIGGAGSQLWGDLMSQGGNFYNFIMKSIQDPNSGLAAAQQKQLRSLLGDVAGSINPERGQFALWMDEIGNSGTITVKDSQGNPLTIKIPDSVKGEIYRTMTSGGSEEDIQTSVTDLIKKITVDPEHTVDAYLQDLISSVGTSGDTSKAVKKFVDGLTASLATFAGSKTEGLLTKTLADYAKDNPLYYRDTDGTTKQATHDDIVKGLGTDLLNRIYQQQSEPTKKSLREKIVNLLSATQATYTSDVETKLADWDTKLGKQMADLNTKRTTYAKQLQSLADIPGQVFDQIYAKFDSPDTDKDALGSYRTAWDKSYQEVLTSPWYRQLGLRTIRTPGMPYDPPKNFGPHTARDISTVMAAPGLLKVMIELNPQLANNSLVRTLSQANSLRDQLKMAADGGDFKWFEDVAKGFEALLESFQSDKEKLKTTFTQADSSKKYYVGKMNEIKDALIAADKEATEQQKTIQSQREALKTATKYTTENVVTDAEGLVQSLLGDDSAAADAGLKVMEKDGVGYLSFGEGKYVPIEDTTAILTSIASQFGTNSAITTDAILTAAMEIAAPEYTGAQALPEVTLPAMKLPENKPAPFVPTPDGLGLPDEREKRRLEAEAKKNKLEQSARLKDRKPVSQGPFWEESAVANDDDLNAVVWPTLTSEDDNDNGRRHEDKKEPSSRTPATRDRIDERRTNL